MESKGFKKLIVWQKADSLAFNIYLETKKFPSDELYGMTSHCRRDGKTEGQRNKTVC